MSPLVHRTYNDQDTDPAVDSPPKHCLTSSSQSSVMHTYANPFQNGGCGGSTFSEDTTGPIIPDMNTLRPSQVRSSGHAFTRTFLMTHMMIVLTRP